MKNVNNSLNGLIFTDQERREAVADIIYIIVKEGKLKFINEDFRKYASTNRSSIMTVSVFMIGVGAAGFLLGAFVLIWFNAFLAGKFIVTGALTFFFFWRWFNKELMIKAREFSEKAAEAIFDKDDFNLIYDEVFEALLKFKALVGPITRDLSD